MDIRKMERTLGRLEANLQGTPAAKAEDKPQGSAKSIGEISKAPAPISPLSGKGAPVSTNLSGSDEFHGSYEAFKKARMSGRIK